MEPFLRWRTHSTGTALLFWNSMVARFLWPQSRKPQGGGFCRAGKKQRGTVGYNRGSINLYQSRYDRRNMINMMRFRRKRKPENLNPVIRTEKNVCFFQIRHAFPSYPLGTLKYLGILQVSKRKLGCTTSLKLHTHDDATKIDGPWIEKNMSFFVFLGIPLLSLCSRTTESA